MTRTRSIGEAVIGLLEAYGVDTVFGIPGVHNVELYRALPGSAIRHVLPRHEQGAGFMADGYARVTGRPAACFTITGPGVLNIATPIGQAYADSQPMIVIASCLDVGDGGLGRGRLHEMRDQLAAARAVAGRASRAYTGRDVEDELAVAFALFASRRPRPVYLDIPIDVLTAACERELASREPPARAQARQADIEEAARLIDNAARPAIIVGGGGRHAGAAVAAIAERAGAVIFTTAAGKGVVAGDHPLHIGAALASPVASEILRRSDLVLVAGSELSETDFWFETFTPGGPVVRIDLDEAVLARAPAAKLAINADAVDTLARIAAAVGGNGDQAAAERRAEQARSAIVAGDDDLTAMLRQVLQTMRSVLDEDAVVVSDMTQIAYAGNEAFACSRPDCWLHPSGFGTLGYGLPAAIGARIGAPERTVVALVGDYGFQYTLNELGTAVELGDPLVVVLWNNNALKQIRDDMVDKRIQPNAVSLKNPDFQALAKAYGCRAYRPQTLGEFARELSAACSAPAVTVIEISPQIVT